METVLDPQNRKKPTAKLSPQLSKFGNKRFRRVFNPDGDDNNQVLLIDPRTNKVIGKMEGDSFRRGKESFFDVGELIVEYCSSSTLPTIPKEVIKRIRDLELNPEIYSQKQSSLFLYPDNDIITVHRSAPNRNQKSTDILKSEDYNNNDTNALFHQLEVYRRSMKRMVPVSLAILAGFFLVLSSVLLTILIISIKLKTVILNPWYMIPLTVGSIGLLVTVMLAVHEWRKALNVTQEKK